jgi:hypothetical protein
VTSRSNCAKVSSMFRVRRPIEGVVLNCCVTDTNERYYRMLWIRQAAS